MNDKYITVSSLTKYIKYKIDNDSNLQEVFIKGEISNFKAHSRGHYYFTLKDEESRINAIMFATNTKKVPFMPSDGMKVLITGKVSVYETTGAYQIYVNDMLEDGVGNLYIAYEQLKKKLEEKGMFDDKHKKAIPKIPNKIGVITAKTGAAIKDILSTIDRRWPLVEVYLYPVLVQGEEAKYDIVKKIKQADLDNLDVLIVGRGGGSIEDLWNFNEEIVANAIYEAQTPIISAVGHEVDFTIADAVADKRAPTPTGAAEMAVPNISDVITVIKQFEIRATKFINNLLTYKEQQLQELKNNYVFKNPYGLYELKEQQFSYILDKIKYGAKEIIHKKESLLEVYTNNYIIKNPEKILEKKQQNYAILLSKLETLNPLTTLKRGYTIVKVNDKAISKSKDLKTGDIINVEFQDGKIKSKVI